MNKLVTLLIVFLAGLVIAGHMNHNPEENHEKVLDTFKYTGYETDDTSYVLGQVLLPDYVHTDTLVVILPELLNKMMADPNVGSDEELSEILGECTIPIEDYEDYMKQLQITNLKHSK